MKICIHSHNAVVLATLCLALVFMACERPAPGVVTITPATTAVVVQATATSGQSPAVSQTAVSQTAVPKDTVIASASSPTSQLPTATVPPPTATILSPTQPPATTAPPTLAPATSLPPTALPATATTVPPTRLPTSVPIVPKRIVFETGATSASVDGHLAARGVDVYLLRASVGQLMDVTVFAPDNSVKLTVRGIAGELVSGNALGANRFQGVLPKTQDYVIEVAAQGQTVNYTLSVVIPQRISFKPGATSVILDGNLVPQRRDHYVLLADANQLLDLSVIVAGSGAQLIIYGADGAVLKSGMGEGTSFSGLLPKKQDYLIEVGSNRALSYRLQVIIPERISFAPGATSATVQGGLAVAETHHYILRASAGQTMTVKVTSPTSSVLPTIYGLDGAVLKRALDGLSEWQGKLPSTQEYRIDLVSGKLATYKMEVTIK